MGSVKNDDFPAKISQEQTLPFLMDYLPEVHQIKCEKELNETDKTKIEGLRELREKIKSKKNINAIDFHDDVLKLFLRHSKYDVKRSLKRLEKAITLRKEYLIFKEDTDEKFAEIIAEKMYSILPRRTKEGCIVFITKYGRWDPDLVPAYYFLRYAVLVIQQFLRDQITQISGLVCIYDLKNFSLKHVRQFTLFNLYEAVNVFLDCIPIRYKEVHVINHSNIAKVVWTILKPLLGEKIRKRFIFHSSPEELCDYIPATALPIEYGGILNEEEMNEPEMSRWMKKACDEQRQCSLGTQRNFY